MCGSMVDIQSAVAEIRRGKKDRRRRKKPQGKNIMSASATQGGHKQITDMLITILCTSTGGKVANMDLPTKPENGF